MKSLLQKIQAHSATTFTVGLITAFGGFAALFSYEIFRNIYG